MSFTFARRHIGPDAAQQKKMLDSLGLTSLDELINKTVPANIRTQQPYQIGQGLSESDSLIRAREIAGKNQVFKSYIGMGYYGTHTPPVIQRNILENPGWYTAYTPYQAEISQGRMEALLNFQTMIMELTGFDLANASLLDEATAAAEAMFLCFNAKSAKSHSSKKMFVDLRSFPQTIEVLKTRATPLGLELIIDDPKSYAFNEPLFAAFLQQTSLDGEIRDLENSVKKAKAQGAMIIMNCDLLAITLVKSPAEMGADVAIGSSQRFGVPMGFGGPHAAFIATRDEFKRLVPGRFIGVSKDTEGHLALRLALQTREQHIRREKASSNICTSQVLLAVMASMYAVYHGPQGLKNIALRVHRMTVFVRAELLKLGYKIKGDVFFDTLTVETEKTSEILKACEAQKINLRKVSPNSFGISFDESISLGDLNLLLSALSLGKKYSVSEKSLVESALALGPNLLRKTDFLKQNVFNKYHSETEMLRYIHRLEAKDLSLTTSMIPLGSCTMKLNATSEMYPVTWPEFCNLHPFTPQEQTVGYRQLFLELEKWLADITGFSAMSLQPNAGSQGEYAGLLIINAYHLSRGEKNRNICLIPSSAHGTNPASAVLAGFKVVVVACDASGNVDVADLKNKAKENQKNLSALMITYPSTHGVFEESIKDICKIVHDHGGQVYMDGANMNALVGLCRPAEFGADVAHLNLHKTFCIPHGGGGPGMGPIGVAKHLTPFLPSHVVVPECGPKTGTSAVSAAPWGSAGILPISWAFIQMMGSEGLREATEIAILNANYMANRLDRYFPVLYKGKNGLVAHECIIDLRPIKNATDVSVDDVAKRLMDYGFHAPTMSFPVPGTFMIEPTESESLPELDRFCDALISIYEEIKLVETGQMPRNNNPLRNAPHTSGVLLRSTWDRPYSREVAAFPKPWLREHKYWPPVSRVDNAYGDKNFNCSCEPMESYQ
ncbi:MAG: aminomethyl-transferring glycine dehydrogenase [Pseudomonadota bacterium]|nr:aminomethyl-transferring glycine dehydrogenase [Pseudomonadota bacterium]